MTQFGTICFYFLLSFCGGDYDFEIDKDDIETFEIGSMQLFDHGSFMMGTNDKRFKIRAEFPIRREYAKPFLIDRYPVTNADFASFVKETLYYTTQPDLNKFSFVYYRHLQPDAKRYDMKYLASQPWMIPVLRARWDKPYGKHIDIMTKAYHPVVHVSFVDAFAYCNHIKKRLPNEYEWEMAARANNKSWDFPWGFGMRRNRMNIFQGLFPAHDHGYDGYKDVSPVNAYPAQNNMGMFDMLGNVWEWTTTKYIGLDLPPDANRKDYVTLKGGSFLDTLDGRNGTMPVRSSIKVGRPYQYTAGNVGFRCAQTVAVTPRPPRLVRYEDTREYRMKIEKLTKKFIQLKKKIVKPPKPIPVNKTDAHVHFFSRDEL